MALIKVINDNCSSSDNDKIRKFLQHQGIDFGTFPISLTVREMIQPRSLTDEVRKNLIQQYPETIKKFSSKQGYRADVVCFYPELVDLDFIISKFGSIHYHYENEYWYFLEGAASFGFCGKDGTKFELTTNAGEFLQVPEGWWQWFSLTPEKTMKAVRFFYTDQSISPRIPVVL